jgi:hypothetical protein
MTIEALFHSLTTFVPAQWWGWLIGLSILGFFGTLILLPVILIRLPPTYFDARYPRHWLQGSHPFLRGLAYLLKNTVGMVFLAAGLAMLVLPGQGLLTMLIGLSLIDFPGKQRLEAALLGHPTVLKAINALRAKFGRPPFTVSSSETPLPPPVAD